MKSNTLRHSFVKYIPEILEDNVLYLSLDYCTAMHKCMCGCGNKVVTPITPFDWTLTFDGETVSLNPSIGNWNFDCNSHYWIKQSKVEWAGKWSKKQIDNGRQKDQINKQRHFKQVEIQVIEAKTEQVEIENVKKPSLSLYKKIVDWLRYLFK